MDAILVRATKEDAGNYIRIAKLNISQFNTIATDHEEVVQEIEESVVYMIRVEGNSVGFVSYVMKKPNQAYISEVQIQPDFRGRGIGGHALSAILEELKDIDVVYLWTHPKNPAQKLYRRHGFLENGEIIENDNNTGEPRMKMCLVRVGDRVMYKAQLNDPGHYKPDDMLPSEVICRYKNGAHFTYRIRLDMKWSDRVPARGQSIIVGNVHAGRLSREREK